VKVGVIGGKGEYEMDANANPAQGFCIEEKRDVVLPFKSNDDRKTTKTLAMHGRTRFEELIAK
jgi:hypothetical protein